MNLTSCSSCGVVLDKDNLNFPTEITDLKGVINTDIAVWVKELGSFVPISHCPVCKGIILKMDPK